LQRTQVVLQTSIKACRDLEPGGDKKPPNTSDAADENVARNEADHVAELEASHEIEHKARHHGTQTVCHYSGRNDSIRIVFANNIRYLLCHVMEKGHHLDLYCTD
jgi:hypothetical protein